MHAPHLARQLFAASLAACCLAWSQAASAQLDYTRRTVNVRAGPDNAFPQVARLANGSNVHVFGCTDAAGRRWCDVLSGRVRGWVQQSDLSQSSRVRNAPTVTFSVAEYWEAHYRSRRWLSSVDLWKGWGTPGFVAPPVTPGT
jgi:uncharacterized protein YraI